MCLPGAAVLIRALEPTHGLERMRQRRGAEDVLKLCSGPARLAQALAVTGAQDGLSLLAPPFALSQKTGAAGPPRIVTGPRIGISRAAHLPWRFGAEGSAFLSRRFA